MKQFKKVGDIFQCKLNLEDGTDFIIPMREDGYIFATALCKTVGKKPNDWLRLRETKNLIKDLEKSKSGIPDLQLIEVYKGNSSKYNSGTWIHPDLGIQLAQWCSPSFSLQVSKWIRELIITDKVELGKEKSNNSLQEELNKIIKQLEEQIEINKKTKEELNETKEELNETKEELNGTKEELNETKEELNEKNKEYQFLANKINRFQKRQSYPDKNVIYIITNEELKKERVFLLGKAVDLKIRLTTYNKSSEHEVIYYKNFKNMYQMNTAEMMVLYKLDKYRDQTSKRERFILPEDEDISVFKNIFDEAHTWFNNIENVVVETTPDCDTDIEISKKQRKFKPNSVYILTSKVHEVKRTYIIGKSKNLNGRLSAYNKGIYHKVVYCKPCKNKYHMNIIELMILYKLDNYRERMNRDRFILPEDKDITFFTDIFDNAVNWFEDIEKDLVIIKDKEAKQQDVKERKKNYRELNIERIKENDKQYREKNRDKLLVKQKEYRETHKEQVSNIKKEWYKKNKEKVINRIKKNYENNKEKKIEKVKEYANKNKEKIKETRASKTITCECGITLQKYGLKKHLQTTKHKEIMKNMCIDYELQ